ncbi:hypothetical protein SESBI_24012 [Sesbania bispinosa]|nr:hypothetical protein SESBI_24012 [Sesbania bispinosa]
MKTIPLILMGCGGVGCHLLQHIVSCHSLHSTQGLCLRVVGVGDSKSLVVVEDLLNKGLDDSLLLELCRVKRGGESLSKLHEFGECRVFVHLESQGKILEIASQLGKQTDVVTLAKMNQRMVIAQLCSKGGTMMLAIRLMGY